MIDTILNYLGASSVITIIVLTLLSFYFILLLWIFIYKQNQLSNLIKIEHQSLENLLVTSKLNPLSKLGQCLETDIVSKEVLKACEVSFIRDATNGLQWLSIISSTAPFIGLFGTVVGILESFAKFATSAKVSFNIIAPAISEALVATAAGILVAIFAYTFHQLISRKVYLFDTYLKSQSEILLSRK